MNLLYLTLLMFGLYNTPLIDDNLFSTMSNSLLEQQIDDQQPSIMSSRLDSLKLDRMMKREGFIIIKPNPFWTNMIFAIMGCFGILLKIAIQLVKNKKKKISDFIEYINEDSLVVLVSFGCYIVIIVMWWIEGLDFFGMFKGVLNAMTFFVGLGAERMLATAMKEKNMEIDSIPIDDDKKDENPKTV